MLVLNMIDEMKLVGSKNMEFMLVKWLTIYSGGRVIDLSIFEKIQEGDLVI